MSKNIKSVDIIIPTYNNPDMLVQCIGSIGMTRLSHPVNIIIINNGHPASLDNIGVESWFTIVQTGGVNLGWEGGLRKGLELSKSDYVMFMNDDTYILQSEDDWLRKMVTMFENPKVAAVGPISNVVTGVQNMLYKTPHSSIQTTYLIGFCMLLRREYLDEIGGIDDSLPGGDDFDLSIRFRKAGYDLICKRDVFVYHYGFVTGQALHGGPNKKGGWNSQEMIDKVNMALIKKHGFDEWFKCVAGYSYPGLVKGDDHEGDIIRKYVKGDIILDLGCANNKTVPNAIGIDRIPKGETVPCLNAVSEGDIIADVEEKIPYKDNSVDIVIARHILEHCIDVVKTLNEWKRIIKANGKLIIAVPNENLLKTIPMNSEHVHAFTPESLISIAQLLGFNFINQEFSNGGSFVSVFEKNGLNNGCQ